MKRTAALVLSLILCVSLATSAFALPSGSSYSETYYPEEIIVQTLSNGNVSATIPSSSITAGKAVVLPTTVKAADSSEAASTISLSIPKNASGVKVEIPVSNLSEGTVVVLVNADGTEKIFKASTTTEKGVSFVVNSSCTVKIVNNEKTFSDLSGWEVPGVAYVSSRELLIGDNNGNFLPTMNMSKAMIVTVLSRIEDSTMETTGDNWYAQSLAWATAAGLTDATDPEAPVTRVDMVRMLYKYAGSPAVTCDLSAFADAGELSGDGLAAMQWAVKNGIVIGNGLGLLDPAGYTTRSIFATLLMRYCALVG